MNKILFFDCETTGLYPNKHGIWQYAGILTIDGKEVDRIEIQCLPIEGKVVDKRALESIGVSVDIFGTKSLPKGEIAFYQFRTFIDQHIDRFNKRDKLVLCGYNIKFDEDFLRNTWKVMGDKYFGSYFTKPSLDVFQLAMMELGPEWFKMKDHKLQTVATRILGNHVTGDAEWHDAMVDIEMTKKIFDKIYTKRYRQIEQSVLR